MKLNDPDHSMNAALRSMLEKHAQFEVSLKEVRSAGADSLVRLMKLAQGHSGQSRVIASFLLGLYDGRRFRFDLTDFRRTDIEIHNDCMRVLRMDFSPQYEVHACFDQGEKLFEQLALDWSITDVIALENNSNNQGQK